VLERSPLMRGWDSKTTPKTAQDLDREIALFMQKPRHTAYRDKRQKLMKRKVIKRKVWF
jgi:hypothetical protein